MKSINKWLLAAASGLALSQPALAREPLSFGAIHSVRPRESGDPVVALDSRFRGNELSEPIVEAVGPGMMAPIFAADAASGGNDSFTKLLLHMDGADASTTFTDSSASAHTVTANGNAQIDTAQSKFGGASGLFDGTGDVLTTPDSTDWTFGSGDFTVDCWFRINAEQGTRRFIFCQSGPLAQPTDMSIGVEVSAANVLHAFLSDGTAFTTITGTTGLSTATWYHMAFVRSGNTLTLYLAGTSEGTASFTASVFDATATWQIGELAAYGFDWNGWIDEFRVSKGIARWTANFTPPTAAYS
jgi:hypothetical protein